MDSAPPRTGAPHTPARVDGGDHARSRVGGARPLPRRRGGSLPDRSRLASPRLGSDDASGRRRGFLRARPGRSSRRRRRLAALGGHLRRPPRPERRLETSAPRRGHRVGGAAGPPGRHGRVRRRVRDVRASDARPVRRAPDALAARRLRPRRGRLPRVRRAERRGEPRRRVPARVPARRPRDGRLHAARVGRVRILRRAGGARPGGGGRAPRGLHARRALRCAAAGGGEHHIHLVHGLSHEGQRDARPPDPVGPGVGGALLPRGSETVARRRFRFRFRWR